MKRICFITAIVLFGANFIFAQQEKNQVAISLGAASSLAGTIINLSGDQNSTTSPAVNISADLGMNNKFSLGISYCYQNFAINGLAYYYSYLNGMTVSTTTNYKTVQNRHNAGVRFLFHFTEKKDIDFYAGLRLSYLFNDISSDMPTNLNYTYSTGTRDVLGGTKNRYTQQLVIGGKYYWNETFGVFSELGIGFPYAFNVGLVMRLQ